MFQKGFAHLLLIFLAAAGLIIFLLFSSSVDFKNKLFSYLFPNKPPSHAVSPKAESVPDELLIKFKAGVDETKKANTLKHFGLKKQDEIDKIHVTRVKVNPHSKEKVLQALKRNPLVQYIEENYLAKVKTTPAVNDVYYTYGYQWNMDIIHSPQAWDISKGDQNVVIAIIDTGVKADHEDLQGKVISQQNLIDTSGTDDVVGHGTIVAGIAAANTNNSIGIASLARNNKIMSLKVCNDTGSCTYSAIAKAVNYAADNGVKIINISLGGASTSSSLQRAIDYAWGKGLVIIATSGNSGINWIEYPAAMDYVVAVGATTPTDVKAGFSNYGNKLSVVAPGEGVYSTDIYGVYDFYAGTSFATSHVSALAALIFSANPSLTNQSVMDIIQGTTDKLKGYSYDPVTGKDLQTGYGRINAYAAVLKAKESTSSATLDTQSPQVSITSPSSGAEIKGGVNITLDAQDSAGVLNTEVYIDGKLFANATAPYQYYWDSTTASNDVHTIYAKAYDNSGNIGTSSTITVNVNNIIDNPPTVLISYPANNQEVQGVVNVSFQASDDIALNSLVLRINNNIPPDLSCTVSGKNGSCNYPYDTTQETNLTPQITASALDSASHLTETTITVTVNNPAPTATITPTPTPTPTPIPDTTPPTVSITSPSGTYVTAGGKTTIIASATDMGGIQRVEFYIGSTLKCTDTIYSYSCSWNVPTRKGVNYIIKAAAYDLSNNSSSTSITVKSQ